MKDPTLREAAAVVEQIHFLKAIAEVHAEQDPKWRHNTYEPYFKPCIVPKLDGLKAALDRPDGEAALEEAHSLTSFYIFVPVTTDKAIGFSLAGHVRHRSISELPNLAAWIKSREEQT